LGLSCCGSVGCASRRTRFAHHQPLTDCPCRCSLPRVRMRRHNRGGLAIIQPCLAVALCFCGSRTGRDCTGRLHMCWHAPRLLGAGLTRRAPRLASPHRADCRWAGACRSGSCPAGSRAARSARRVPDGSPGSQGLQHRGRTALPRQHGSENTQDRQRRTQQVSRITGGSTNSLSATGAWNRAGR